MRILKKSFKSWLEAYENDDQVPCLDAINSRISEVHEKLSLAELPHTIADVYASFPGSTFFFSQKLDSDSDEDPGISFAIGHNIFRLSEAGFAAKPEEPFYFLLGFAQGDEPPEFAKLPKDAFVSVSNDTTYWTPAYAEILTCADQDDLINLQKKFNDQIPDPNSTDEEVAEAACQDDPKPTGAYETAFPKPFSFVPPFLVYCVQEAIKDATISCTERGIPAKEFPSSVACEVLVSALNEFNTFCSEHNDIANASAVACKDFFLQLWVASTMLDVPEDIPAIDGFSLFTNYRLEGAKKGNQIKDKISTAGTKLLVSTDGKRRPGSRATIDQGHDDDDSGVADLVTRSPAINIINKNESLEKLVNTLTDSLNGSLNTSGEGSASKNAFLSDTQRCMVRLFHAFGNEEASPAVQLHPKARQFMLQSKAKE